MAVYVENAGFGGDIAAPIAGLVIEKYLKGEVKRPLLEEQMVNIDLISKDLPEPVEEPEKKKKEEGDNEDKQEAVAKKPVVENSEEQKTIGQ